jgi:hypothetical protein
MKDIDVAEVGAELSERIRQLFSRRVASSMRCCLQPVRMKCRTRSATDAEQKSRIHRLRSTSVKLKEETIVADNKHRDVKGSVPRVEEWTSEAGVHLLTQLARSEVKRESTFEQLNLPRWERSWLRRVLKWNFVRQRPSAQKEWHIVRSLAEELDELRRRQAMRRISVPRNQKEFRGNLSQFELLKRSIGSPQSAVNGTTGLEGTHGPAPISGPRTCAERISTTCTSTALSCDGRTFLTAISAVFVFLVACL